ncbi:MAG: site-specific DNA-methyltransferase [Calditrichaeota bacterium]|nr:MAG: site-specific DNA-methyltransferase [Calditrichota bacterium]
MDKLYQILTNFPEIEDNEKSERAYPTGKTRFQKIKISEHTIPVFINEYWTSRQRQASPLHEIAYRACFKPQLPRFFIQLLTKPGEVVYDPFSGRGTTILEAALLGRNVIANDVNPLSQILTKPRLFIPTLEEVAERLQTIPMDKSLRAELDLSMFYHPLTEAEIVSLRQYLRTRKAQGKEDHIDRWIRMIATNRLTGHSPGFFSVYTLPPNQAVSPERQKIINARRQQIPEYRDTRALILRKTRRMTNRVSMEERRRLAEVGQKALFLTEDARFTDAIQSASVQLTVTSPPFLNVVQYADDNWLRCWFNSIDVKQVEATITTTSTLSRWCEVMEGVFKELFRITKQGGWVAFEVGEVKKGKIRLEESVIPLGISAGFQCFGVMINLQKFTKTANIWGITNNLKGTNTNRIVLFYKP